jgi:hypothetical protein
MCERGTRLAHEPVAELPLPVPALGDEVVSLRPRHETDVPAKLMAFGDPVGQRPAAYRALQARPTPARAVQSASGSRRATACRASSSVIFQAVRSRSARLLAGEGVDRREQRLSEPSRSGTQDPGRGRHGGQRPAAVLDSPRSASRARQRDHPLDGGLSVMRLDVDGGGNWLVQLGVP